MLAPMQLTSLLVPAMQKQKWGLIVNIGSVAGGERACCTKAKAWSALSGLLGLSAVNCIAVCNQLSLHNL